MISRPTTVPSRTRLPVSSGFSFTGERNKPVNHDQPALAQPPSTGGTFQAQAIIPQGLILGELPGTQLSGNLMILAGVKMVHMG
jgi:hypothetical protein